MIGSYKDLKVYAKTYEYALSIHRISLTFPQQEQYELGSQIRRATKSIPLNIAEGYGKRESVAEFRRYLSMSIGSCDEVRVLLEFCKDLSYISAAQHAEYVQAYDEAGKMLASLAQNWKKF